jgi:hypothetical protein
VEKASHGIEMYKFQNQGPLFYDSTGLILETIKDTAGWCLKSEAVISNLRDGSVL